MKYNHILFPTDGSSDSKKALVHLKMIARTFQPKITILCVYDLPYTLVNNYSLVNSGVLEQYKDDNRQRALKIAEETVNEIGLFQLEIEKKVVQGNPKLVIPDVAEAIGCDLIIMGTRGHKNMNYIGSTATHVINSTPGCPVLVVN